MTRNVVKNWQKYGKNAENKSKFKKKCWKIGKSWLKIVKIIEFWKIYVTRCEKMKKNDQKSRNNVEKWVKIDLKSLKITKNWLKIFNKLFT